MAEVHIIGQIESARDFPDARLSCHWQLQIGGGWELIEGIREGRTQTDLPEIDNVAYFCHPIDVHLATKTIQGWPKMHLQVWHYDQFGRQELYAYGCCFVPISPGEHEVILIQFLINNHHQVQCHTWRPIGGVRDEMTQSFVGGGQQLRSLESLSNPIDRMRLRTIAMGRVTIRLAIVVRHFDRYGIIC